MSYLKNIILSITFLTHVFSYGQDQIFATISGGDLYSIDVQNCSRSFVGSTGFGFGDIAITPNGQLWGTVSNSLYSISPTTAEATLIGTGLGPGVSLVALNDTILLRESGLNLIGINTNTAETFFIDTIGFQASGDLTWYDEDLYMVTSTGMIIRIELAEDFESIENITPVGMGIPTCEGAITATFPDDINYLVGFNGPDLLKVCPFDGSYELLCPQLNVGGTPGAAATRLEIQEPNPASCDVTSVVDFSKDIKLSIYPNPAENEVKITTQIKGIISYSICNMTGQQVQSGQITEQASIPVKLLNSGIYFIKFEIGTTLLTRKLIKNK